MTPHRRGFRRLTRASARGPPTPLDQGPQDMVRPHVPPPPPAPDESDDLSDKDGSPPLLSEPEGARFNVIQASRKQRVTPLQLASPKPAEYSPMLTGNSFADDNAYDATDEHAAADLDNALYKAVMAQTPDVGHILRRQEQKLAMTYATLMDNLFKMLDGRFAKMDDRFDKLTSSIDKGEKRQEESMSNLENRLLAKIEAFNGQIGNLRTDTIDHERRINDQDRGIDELKSNLLKMESVHKGFKDTNNELVATLHTDVNDTRAKIPELLRKYQDSAAGLATSIKEVAALIYDLRQQQQKPVDTPSAATPVRGTSVNPPPTPGLTRFNLPGGINPTFRGTASFPSGNSQTRDTAAPPDSGAHQTNQSIGGPYAPATPSPVPQGALRRDPSSVDLASLIGGCPPPDIPHVTFNTPSRAGAHEVVLDVLIVGEGITSPRPSDKECLARS